MIVELYSVFWDVVCRYLQKYYINFELRKDSILLGNTSENSFLNFFIIVVKNYIYHCKFKDKIPNITELKSKLVYIRSIEECIAMKNNNIVKFENKWTPLRDIFP